MTQLPGSHLDLDTVADLDADLLAQDEAAAARAHLADCTQCSQELARLRTTRALLSTMPTESMPQDVTARVETALRHEQEAPAPRGTVVPIGRRRWNSAAVAGAAAGIAIIGLIAAVALGSIRSGNHGSSSGSTADRAGGAGSALSRAPESVKRWATGRNYTAGSLAGLVPPLVVGTPPATGGGAQTAAPPVSSPATGAGRGYTIDQLRSSPAAVIDCGRILGGGTAAAPLAVDFAKYDGKPAAIFVLPTAGHPESLDVWVVRSTCSASSLDYYFRRIPRSG